MKIAMFGHKTVPSREGGIEVVVTELCSRLAAQGHQVVCYNRSHLSGGGKQSVWQGVALKSAPTIHGKGLAALSSSFFAAIASAVSDADVVHIHALGPAFWCWIPRLAGKKTVVTVHGLDWQREKWKGTPAAALIRAGEKMAVRFAHEIIVLSKNAQDYFLTVYGRKVRRIPNAVTLPDSAVGKLPEGFGLKKDGYLLYLGRLVPEKGAHHLIETFRTVSTEKKLVIAGASSDSDGYVTFLKTLASGDDRICFTGFADEGTVAALMEKAYLYILPSQLEGMPLTLLEAMSFGCCCLVSDIPECTEVVGDSGVVVEKGDCGALAKAIQKLCGCPERVEAFREKARIRFQTFPDWEKVTEMTLEVYR